MKHKITLWSVLIVLAAVLNHASAHDDRWADSHSGNDTGVNERVHAGRWDTDGCSNVMDSQNGVFHFEHACDHHDGCYREQWAGRLACDNEFWRNMEASCKHDWAWWNPARTACRNIRDIYYVGVRQFGFPAYYYRTIRARIG